ncbi:N-acetyltransferase family protein [Sphingobacterium sp. LRF_L2]|uniref:GNAT family N-acetyltransferase n=1 Tax=Sphingobacterium sp. LRF_L2 TaxID=3369421 RepID=UPI003F5D5CA3
MTDLVFRDANIDDLGVIVAIYNSTVASRMVTADTEEISTESRIPWLEAHGSQRPLWIVEDPSGKIYGWVSFQSFYGRPAYNGTAEISIYLDPDARGMGIGKKVLEHSLEKAPSLGIITLLAFIFAHNIPSLALFYRYGFEDWANLPRVAKMDDDEYSLKILGKRLIT